MRRTGLAIAFQIWGPMKITVERSAREVWGKPSRESLRAVFAALRPQRLRTGRPLLAPPSRGKQ